MAAKIDTHRDVAVYQRAMDAAMTLFETSKAFPREETYSLTDQMRRSSRSVCANLAEAWRKRRYEAAFIAKVSDSESEAAETQVWLEFAAKCAYMNRDDARKLHQSYEEIQKMLVSMINNPSVWIMHQDQRKLREDQPEYDPFSS